MANIQVAYNWAIEVCNKPNVGYSQQYRNQRTVNGITYYDCSSFIWYALISGGWDLESKYGTWPFTTSTMANILVQEGFTRHEPSVPWLKGDILLRSTHTEMAFDATRTMGAHTSTVPLDEQVSINANDSRGNWLHLYRYGQGAISEWIKGNRYLAIGEMQNNATIQFAYFMDKGWTANAVAGMLGNQQVESTLNPGIWQNLTPGTGGFGLVQWTPSANYTDWADQHGYTHDDGNGQMEWIDTETVPFGQWIPTSQYPETFEEFKASTQSPEYLADCFLKNFERPSEIDQPIRQEYARYWYDWFEGHYVPPPNPPGAPDWRHRMPLYMYLKKL